MTPEQYAALKDVIDNELNTAQSKIETIKGELENDLANIDEDDEDAQMEIQNLIDSLEAACADIDDAINNVSETNPGAG